jgi:hypothetical protein
MRDVSQDSASTGPQLVTVDADHVLALPNAETDSVFCQSVTVVAAAVGKQSLVASVTYTNQRNMIKPASTSFMFVRHSPFAVSASVAATNPVQHHSARSGCVGRMRGNVLSPRTEYRRVEAYICSTWCEPRRTTSFDMDAKRRTKTTAAKHFNNVKQGQWPKQHWIDSKMRATSSWPTTSHMSACSHFSPCVR